ncbi:peptidoglycan DD-metalloendopeptidase family protein [Echinimonas agarilytica]|uniref:Peptidoglycan DD-metalloendopeptidase family protein n=1 Tax=Echinimonas agarilytica TaxID=1215918 RepID=A0AA41W4F9_9GAMM|nr:peptidoglycan DD-metalloendopeptidase family protein [Echinimonas agarilytica]MCM2678660.1 peptidoglycan DD-metalloendopeptidase family protein [Echinimonas agarilytica]
MKRMILRIPSSHRWLILVCSAFILTGMIWPTEQAKATRNAESLWQLELNKRYPIPMAIDSSESQNAIAVEENRLDWHVERVKSGDSLAKLFQRAGFSARTLHHIMALGQPVKALKKIHPGDRISFAKGANGELLELAYPINETETLLVQAAGDDSFSAKTDVKQFETRTDYAGATIRSNFWNAGIESGLTPNLIMSLANVFGWDIDFALDIRKGDSFSVIYETRYLNGEFAGYGDIIGAEFINQGERHRAIRNVDGNYFSPDGHAMRKAFLRAPVNFKYISSSFNPRRLHPVTGKVRPHRGIDYAARTGTPVSSAGDGKVIKSGYSSLNGNYVFIKHGERYVTKYLHLHKRHVKTGQRVKQGMTIGTVGATGRVTGAHLHYEFLVDGVHRNPRTVKLPQSMPIAKADRANFLKQSELIAHQLDSNQKILLAMAGNDE